MTTDKQPNPTAFWYLSVMRIKFAFSYPLHCGMQITYFAVQTAKIIDEGPKNAGFQPPTSILQTCVQLAAEIGAFTLNVDITAVEKEGRVFLLVMATLKVQTSFNPCFARIS